MDVYTGGGVAAIILWSSTIAMVRSLSEKAGPLTGGAAVYLAGGLFCLVRLWWEGRLAARYVAEPLWYVVGCGFLFVLYTILLYAAVGLASSREQVLEVGLVNYLWPSLTVLLSIPLLDKRANFLLLPGTGLALAGVFLVVTQGAEVNWASLSGHVRANPAPYGLAFMAAVAWALYSNLARRWSRPKGKGAVELFILVSGILLFALQFLEREPVRRPAAVALEALVLGAMTALAYGLWDLAMRKGNVLAVAACSYFTPLFSTLVSCAYLQVKPTAQLWVGCLFLIGGSLLTWQSVRDQEGGTD